MPSMPHPEQPSAVPEQSLPPLRADDAAIDEALADANLPTLLLCIAQLTGDVKWLKDPFRPSRTIALDDNDSGGFPEPIQTEIRAAARELLVALRDGTLEIPPAPQGDELIRRLSISLGEQVPPEYASTFEEEAGFATRNGTGWRHGRPSRADLLNVLVIGAGPGGISTARMLEQLGLDYEIVERNDDVGGVWLANDYPGAGVDTPTHMYSFSFAPDGAWTRYYAKQPELLDYLRRTAEKLGIVQRIRFRTEVQRLDWEEEAAEWRIEVRGEHGQTETLRARVVISCVGGLSRPQIPNLTGCDEFSGPMFHSSQWDHELDLTGKRVAVIGTGATAMQIVPEIAGTTAKTLVFQRSPQWVAPNGNYLREVPDGVRLLMQHLPYYQSFYRLRLIWQFQDKLLASLYRDPEWPYPERSVNATNDRHREFFTKHLKRQLEGRPDLIEKTLPTYPPYGKRILMDNDWYKTLRRDDVELINESVAGFDATHVLTVDGESHEADVVVFATGFYATRLLWPIEIHGRGGVALHEQWGDDNASAYLGVSVPNFPNLFLVGGPHTFLGHGGSVLYPNEIAVTHIGQLLVNLVEGDLRSIEVRADVTEDYNRRLDEEHAKLIWTHPGMTTWFRNRHGRVIALAPWRGVDYWSMAHIADLDDYILEPAVLTA
jgi:4-hydroxyacetophenone monooxygenase